jgi:excisionase family DNA binding protein
MSNPFEEIEARLSNIESLLLDIKHGARSTKITDPQSDSEEFLTVKDAAILLRLAVPTIYKLISRGEIPVMKRAKRCYFSKEDLVNYIKQGRKKTAGEISAAADIYLSKKG